MFSRYSSPETVHFKAPSPEIETPDYYRAEEIEHLLLGNSAINVRNILLPHSASSSKGKESELDIYRNYLRQLRQQSPREIEEFNGHLRAKESFALETAFEAFENPNAQPAFFSLLITKMLNIIEQNNNQQSHRKFSIIPTCGSFLDYDYGSDAMVHTASSQQEVKETIQGRRPYVSIGITCIDKRLRETQSGKRIIHSDVELFVSNKIPFIDLLSEPKKPEPATAAIVASTAKAIFTAYRAKEERRPFESIWVDTTAIAEEIRQRFNQQH